MPEIKDYIDPAAAKAIKDAVAEADGNEVFFIGTCGPERRVVQASVAARGDESAVPAIAMSASVGDAVIHNHPSGNLTPSGPDLSIAAMLGSRGVGFFIVNNDATGIYAVVEPFAKETLTPVEDSEIDDAFGEGGMLPSVMDGYEPRPGQIQMAKEVARAFNGRGVAALEAGTGVGKSMAYLVPSILFALKNHERVVVSTNTINLQEQLIHKDIPLLARAIGREFKAVLVKGRSNYLCKRRLDAALGEGELFPDTAEKEDLAALYRWSVKTREGSLSDLNFVPREDMWERVRSEGDTCTRLKCGHFQQCFFFRARREAAAADLLVVNHHILLADIALRSADGASDTGILPGYNRLIIDEGHNIEDGATSYFGSRVSRLGLLKMLGRLHHKRERERGILPFLVRALKGARGGFKPKAEAWKSAIEGRMLMEKDAVSALVNDAFDTLYNFALMHGGGGGAVDGDRPGGGAEVKLRLKDDTKNAQGWPEVVASFEELQAGLARLSRSTDSIRRQVEEDAGDGVMAERLSGPLVELKALSDRLQNVAATLAALIDGSEPGIVRWVEAPARKAGSVIALCGSPLNVAGEIKERVYDRISTVVITSATLTVRQKFDFIMKRTGLELLPGDRLTTAIFPSPFDYAAQMLICIPTDIPGPAGTAFTDALAALVRESLHASRGRAFVLFTSYGMLNKVFRMVEPAIREMGLKALKQGEAPRHKLLDEFRSGRPSALFGTDSFWEGVDVAGAALSNVMIAKLPFSVPDDPVIEARQEEIAASGGSPFMEYIVPQAVIKFRQGLGRLIRTKTDRGSIMLFDRRVIDKNYGRQFLDSLPGGTLAVGDSRMVLERLREFFAAEMV